jgi:plasmid stabilization system protein ParE
MNYTIFWLDTARESYAAILEYVVNQHGVNTALKMDDKVEQLLELLRFNKHLCPPTNTNLNLRRCTVTKQLSLVYKITEVELELVAFYDNRANIVF